MKTVTFYSYKGGVGRTLLMVNLARYLMSRGKKLVLLDCDLEAPGLHYKFDYEKVTSKVSVGVVDFFHQFKRDETLPDMSEMLLESQTHESGGSIHIVPAGDIQTVKYWERLSELDWRDMLYSETGYGFHLFLELRRRIREDLEFQPDYLFIDSRTGITEVGGVVTTVLPDALVCVFINNRENIEGTREVLRAIQRSPSYLPDERRTQTVPVLSRVPFHPENSTIESDLLEKIRGKLNEEAYQLEDTLNVTDISVLHIEPSLAMQEAILVGNPQYSVDASPLYGDYLKLGDILFPDVVTDLNRAKSLLNLAQVHYEKYRVSEAKPLVEKALELYKQVGSVQGEANCIRSLGDIALRRSDHAVAKERYEQALPLYKQVGDVQGEANCIMSLGDIALARSDHAVAKERYEQALALYSRIPEPYSMGVAHFMLAEAVSTDREKAQHLSEARKLWLSIGREDLVEELDSTQA